MTINITSRERPFAFTLGTDVVALRAALEAVRHHEEADPELDRIDFELLDDGISLVCKAQKLSTVFVHLTPEAPFAAPFAGTLDLVPDAFLDAPSQEAFQAVMEAQGYVRTVRQFPNAVDMVTDKVRLRYSDRHDVRMITFDRGDLVR